MRHTMNLQPKWQPVAAGFLALLFLLTGGVTRAQVLLDFDTTAPTSTAELPDFFDLFGFDAEFGDDPFWRVDANNVNADNSSNALHTTSNGNQLEGWFSRVAILKPDVFVGEDVILSADITWDDNDNAGLYVRFNGDSDVPLENNFYFVRGVASGSPDIRIHKVVDGIHEELLRQETDPVPIAEGDTHNLRVRAETVNDTVEISVWLNDEPIPGMDPFVDAFDALLGPGRVGVGQETNPTFFDNISIIGTGGVTPGDFNSDGVVDLADFTILADNFGTGNTFEQGDNNFDRQVDLRDFMELRELLNAPAGAAGAQAVPEPGSLALMCLAGSALWVVRRRNRQFRR